MTWNNVPFTTINNHEDDKEIYLHVNNLFFSYPHDPYIEKFQNLLENAFIKTMIEMDEKCLLLDKYYLAMTYCYFLRCNVGLNEFYVFTFLAALYLVHEIEEDNDYGRMIIFNSLKFGKEKLDRRILYKFNKLRVYLWIKMNYRAIVSRTTCIQIIDMMPNQATWHRSRCTLEFPTNDVLKSDGIKVIEKMKLLKMKI